MAKQSDQEFVRFPIRMKKSDLDLLAEFAVYCGVPLDNLIAVLVGMAMKREGVFGPSGVIAKARATKPRKAAKKK